MFYGAINTQSNTVKKVRTEAETYGVQMASIYVDVIKISSNIGSWFIFGF